VLAVETSGRSGPMLDSKDRHIPNHRTVGRYGMRQVRVTNQRRTAGTAWRRRREPVLPLDPRDSEVTHAKQVQRRRVHP
jgi:hypothetical protein